MTFFINGLKDGAPAEIRKLYDTAVVSGGDLAGLRSELANALGDEVEVRGFKRAGHTGFRTKMRVPGNVSVETAVASIRAMLDDCLDLRFAPASEVASRAAKWEESQQLLKRSAVDMGNLAGLLGRFGRGKYATRGVACLVRDRERTEVAAGVVEQRELNE